MEVLGRGSGACSVLLGSPLYSGHPGFTKEQTRYFRQKRGSAPTIITSANSDQLLYGGGVANYYPRALIIAGEA